MFPTYRPKVFLSYSAPDCDGCSGEEAEPSRREEAELSRRFCLQLEEVLRQKFDVFVDKLTIEPGQDWPSVIEDWLWRCDAAVMLLSEAALMSPWVRFEGLVLEQRWKAQQRRAGGSFRLILVPFPKTTPEKLDAAFAPISFSSIQNLPLISAEQYRDLIDKIYEHLEPLGARIQTRLEENLFSVLRENFSQELLADIARQLPDCPTGWLSLSEGSQRVARALLDIGGELGGRRLESFSNVVRFLWVSSHNVVESVVNWVMPFCWVDPLTSVELYQAAVKKESTALAWTRKWSMSEDMHLLRSFCELNYVLVVTEEESGSREELHRHVQDSIALKLLGDTRVAEADLRDALRYTREQGEFVFVRVPLGTLEKEDIRDLISAWPEVTFFFYDRSDVLNENLASRFEGIEATFLDLDYQRELIARLKYYAYLRGPGGITR